MEVINVIEDEEVIKKILKLLGLWPVESLKVERDRKARPPPNATVPPKTPEYSIDYSTSQIPVPDNWLYVDPDYPESYPPQA